jgi:hypothetical protein
LCDLPRLMIASENGHSVLKSHFQRHQERHCLNRVVASINVVAHKEIVCLWDSTADSEELHQVQKLAVDVATDCHRNFNGLDISLF